MNHVVIINFISAASAIIAAFFWFSSAIVKPRSREKSPDASGWLDASVSIDGSDLSDLLKAQSKRSATAAVFAAVAALLQAIAIVLQIST